MLATVFWTTARIHTCVVLDVQTVYCNMFPYSVSTYSKHKAFSAQVCNLGHTVRLSIISSPWASRMSSYHSSVVIRQTDLHGPPNIEAPMFAKQLNPEDGQKQNKQTAGLAWALLPSTISASAWSQYFWLCFHTELWNFIQCWAPTLHTKLNRLTSSPSPGGLS